MKTIITGTDFTPSSLNANKYAAMLAQKLNCKLTIFNLFDAPLLHSNGGLYGVTLNNQKKGSEMDAKNLLTQLKKLFPKISINYFITSGDFKQEIKNLTKEHKIQAAVMGLDSKDRIAKFIYGSHGVNLAGRIKCPVIIVPSIYKTHKLSRMVLAVDSNEKLNKPHLKGLEKFVQKTNAELKLLHVRTEEELFHPITLEATFNGKKTPINFMKAKTIEDGLKIFYSKDKDDIVAIISKQHSVFYNLFSESNTKKIAFTTGIPVLAIHE